jgi:hypothetical protein
MWWEPSKFRGNIGKLPKVVFPDVSSIYRINFGPIQEGSQAEI